MINLYQRIIDIENSNKKAVLCTIISTKGSSPRKTGAKMLVYENGSIDGTIGGGALEKLIIDQALDVLKRNKPQTVKHNLVTDLAMCCGGTVELFLEPIMNKKKLCIFGAGHIGKALANFARELDFIVYLIDERCKSFEDINNSEIKSINENHFDAIKKLNFDENTMVVILTHNHAYDREILALCSQKPHLYIGMIGSQRKVEIAKKNLKASNILEDEQLSKIDMPIGIEIEAITPQEIAISILAKLISVRNKVKKVKAAASQQLEHN